MSLSDADIRRELHHGGIVVEPLNDDAIQPSSIDLCLGNKFLKFCPTAGTVIDVAQPMDSMFDEVAVDWGDEVLLESGVFVLATTREIVGLSPRVAGQLAGKSSLARSGIIVHFTAGYVDPGWYGNLTFEIMNFLPVPIRLYAGMRIGQIVFTRVETPAETPYGVRGHYHQSTGPEASRYYKSFKRQLAELQRERLPAVVVQ